MEYYSLYKARKKKITEKDEMGLTESFKLVYTIINKYFGLDEVRRIDRWLWWSFYFLLGAVGVLNVVFIWNRW